MTLRFDEMSQHAKQLDKRRKLDKTEKKNISRIWVPGQRREALSGGGVPELDIVVPACACYFCAAWAVNHRRDPAFRWDESARETTRQEKKIRQNWKKKNLTDLSARSAGTQIGEIKKKIYRSIF